MEYTQPQSHGQSTLAMHPRKFVLWLFIMSISMMFASLVSAYIARQAEPDWASFELPSLFYVSTAVVLLSSAAMHGAYLMAKRDSLTAVKAALGLTAVLGVAFLVMQYQGWQQLKGMQVFLAGNPSGSFVYILSGLHGFHIVSGLVYLLVTFVQSFRYRVHAKNLTVIEMCSVYWHFLGALWVALFVFLLLNR